MGAKRILENRELDSKKFADGEGKLAHQWVLDNVAAYARSYAAEGSEIFWNQAKTEFVTDGGDEISGSWNWIDLDAPTSEILAVITHHLR